MARDWRRLSRSSLFLVIVGGIFLPVFAGCSLFNPPVFTKSELEGVRENADFRMIQKHWKRYVGEKVLIGGRVHSVDNRSDRAYIQIEPMPLDEGFRPTSPEQSRGLMMLVMDQPVDPSQLVRGRRITIIGTVRRMRYPVPKDPGGYLRLVTVDVITTHTWISRSQLISPSTGPVMAPTMGGPYVPSGGLP